MLLVTGSMFRALAFYNVSLTFIHFSMCAVESKMHTLPLRLLGFMALRVARWLFPFCVSEENNSLATRHATGHIDRAFRTHHHQRRFEFEQITDQILYFSNFE